MPTIAALQHLPSYCLKNEEEIIWWETGRKIILNSEKSIIFKNLKDIPSNIDSFIMPTNAALQHLPSYCLKSEEEIRWWETGRKITLNREKSIILKNIKDLSPIKVIDPKNNLMGIGIINKKESIYLQPKLVLNAR